MIYIIIGIFSGFISGLGIGGGTILIPSLLFFSQMSQTNAQSINLLSFLPSAAIAITIHWKNKRINTKVLKPIIGYGALGAILGAIIANGINPYYLKKMFAFFLLVMGIKELRTKKQENPK